MQLEGLVIPISFDTGVLLKGVGMITDLIEGAVASTFEWADGMDHLGDVTGMTDAQTAAWAFTVRKAGGDVDSFANSTVIMTKGLFDSEGKLSSTGKALEDFGVSVTDANGNVKDQATLMSDIAGKYAAFGTATERVDFLTNIFGRSGANLVDVFDTLAQEGGIDAVSQKVKDLGLAVDPDRYEQFTRNLNELKLAGTGLAIGLTEKLMPAFEGMLDWAQQFQGMSPDEILSRILQMVSDLPEEFQEWANNVDWEKVSQDLANGIDNIDWNLLGQTIRKNRQIVDKAIRDMFNEIDWSTLFSSIGTAFLDFATGLGGSDFQTFKAVWASNWQQAQDIVYTSIQNADAVVVGWLRSLPGKIALNMALALANLKAWIGKMVSAFSPLTNLLGSVAAGVTGGVAGAAPGLASGGYGGGMTWVGENGPELVNLPQGSYVNNNQSSNRMAQQGPVQAYIDYDELARTLARVLGQQMQRA